MDNFFRNQDKALEKRQKEALKKILKVLNTTKAEISSELSSLPSFQYSLMYQTLKNINYVFEQLQDRLRSEFDDILKEASKVGTDHQIKAVEILGDYSIASHLKASLYGPTELKVFEVLESKVDDFLMRYSAQIREQVKNIIQRGFINGQSQGEVIMAIREKFGTMPGTTWRSVHYIYQSAYSEANHEVLVQLLEQLPFMQKQWYSMIDKDTTLICRGLHEQVKKVDEPFIEPISKSEFMSPPACWGNESLTPAFHACRSRELPYFGRE